MLVSHVEKLYRQKLAELLRGHQQVEWVRGGTAALDDLLRLMTGLAERDLGAGGDEHAVAGGDPEADRGR
jgi:hypothetical protein